MKRMFYWIKKQDTVIGLKSERFAIYTEGDTINSAHYDVESLNRLRPSTATYVYVVEEAHEDVGV